MAVRHILVHIKANEPWSAHVDYAIDTAVRFKARLRGIVTFSEVVVMRSLTHSADSAVEEQQTRDSVVAAELRKRFEAATAAAGIASDFVTGEGTAGELVAWAARMHDLTIVEQLDPRRDELGYDAAEAAALSAGRPVLILPRIGRFTPLPEHILLAWNGSQQSAAALQGALPFIGKAKKVTVCVGEERGRLRSSAHAPAITIREHLQYHVGTVEIEAVEVGSADVGEYLLTRANEIGAGMMVMGAYGRSWFSEFALGGATRHVFRNLTLPVLMGR